MRLLLRALAAAAVVAAVITTPAFASFVMPDFANIPTGWDTDRYDPHSFSNVGSYQGRSNVHGIEINEAEGSYNRPSGQQNTFYNTQGGKHLIAGGPGSILAADLFVESTWLNGSVGHVRTDMWGTMWDGAAITAYPIIGFTNYGGAGRYRVWTTDGWQDISTSVTYGGWTSFAMEFTGSAFEYYINGSHVYTDANANGTVEFKEVIMQAYNFWGDPDAVEMNYTAHWSNSPSEVPEPSTIVLLGILGAGLWVIGRRRR